jgi:hypothetical protein
MAAVNLNNLGDRVLTCAALTVVFASWTVFTAASLVLTATPADELPLDELMARGDSHPLWRRVPKLSYRQTVSSKRIAATALLIPAQLVVYYLMWSYTITGACVCRAGGRACVICPPCLSGLPTRPTLFPQHRHPPSGRYAFLTVTWFG